VGACDSSPQRASALQPHPAILVSCHADAASVGPASVVFPALPLRPPESPWPAPASASTNFSGRAARPRRRTGDRLSVVDRKDGPAESLPSGPMAGHLLAADLGRPPGGNLRPRCRRKSRRCLTSGCTSCGRRGQRRAAAGRPIAVHPREFAREAAYAELGKPSVVGQFPVSGAIRSLIRPDPDPVCRDGNGPRLSRPCSE